MPLSDARRRANNKYIKENMTVLGCKIRREDAETFKAACQEAGTTPNAVFRAAIEDFMEKHTEKEKPEP